MLRTVRVSYAAGLYKEYSLLLRMKNWYMSEIAYRDNNIGMQ